MHEELLNEDIPKSLAQKYLGISWTRLTIIGLIVIAFGIYIGNLLFGDNSLAAFLELQEYQENLGIEVKKLKEENALMQKEYFELKELTIQE